MTTHPTAAELAAGLDQVRAAPADGGTVELIVRRPGLGEREVLEQGELALAEGLVGDTWKDRPSRHSQDGRPHPEMQLNVMSARAALLAAGGDPDRRPLAGDQLYLDLDLSRENLPAGTRLAIGEAVIEVTEQPHNGCAKFAARFGKDAARFFNSPDGRALRLRGLNAKVVVPGTVRRGDAVRKAEHTA